MDTITNSTARTWLRGGLIFLVIYQVVVGFWQYAFPRAFYDHFPTVSLDPPYNEHLMSDVGGLGLTLAAIMAVAAYYLEYRLVVLALLGNSVYAGTHFLFHVTSFDGFTQAEKLQVGVTLGVLVVIPVALLVLARRIDRARWRPRA